MGDWLDSLRYMVALAVLLFAPPGLLIWLFIHPFARFWRRIGVRWAYLCFASLMLVFGLGIWQVRGWLLGIEFGAQIAFIVLAFIFICISVWMALNRQKQLAFTTVIGLPEVSNPGSSRVLVTSGVYARVRNPRYLETLLFVWGCAFFTNYLAIYLILLLGLPVMHLIVLLEERELTQSFGDEYRAYCRLVPRYIPRQTPGWDCALTESGSNRK